MSVTLTGRIHGPDVFADDGDVKWNLVHKHGASFAIFKIAEGMSGPGYEAIDPLATKARVDAIRGNGMIAGGYAYLHPKPGRSGAVEAKQLYDHGREIGLWRADHQKVRDFAPILDCEDTHFDKTTMAGRWRTRRYIGQAVAEIRKLTGHYPIIYSGHWFWWDAIRCNSTFGCESWLAAYTPSYKPFMFPWKDTALWQFSETEKVPGIPGSGNGTDYSVFTGKSNSRAEFLHRLTF